MAPEPSAAAKEHTSAKPIAAKPAGAYRPPGARGLAAPSVYKREDEGGTPIRRSNGNGGHGGGLGSGQRHVPGAGSPNGQANGEGGRSHRSGAGRRGNHVPGAAPANENGNAAGGGDKKKKKKKKKEVKESANADAAAAAGDGDEVVNGDGVLTPKSLDVDTPPVVAVVDADHSVPPTPAVESGTLDPIAKKIRNLNKKVCGDFVCVVFTGIAYAFVVDQGY